MSVLTSSFKNLFQNLRAAFKDRVDLIIFAIIAVLAYFDISGTYYRGAVGFIAFYLFFTLARLGYHKRLIAANKHKPTLTTPDDTVIF